MSKCIVDDCWVAADPETGICRVHSPRRPSLLRLIFQPLIDFLLVVFRQ